MVQICNYSSLIFAGNVTVLLIVSMTTDYWEYRGFNTTALNLTLAGVNHTELLRPADTTSYIKIWYKRKYVFSTIGKYPNETLYEPPIFATNFFPGQTSKAHPMMSTNMSKTSPQTQKRSSDIHSDLKAGMMVLFWQYGNLFRDCDALEGINSIYM